jgi:hypothetical protein
MSMSDIADIKIDVDAHLCMMQTIPRHYYPAPGSQIACTGRGECWIFMYMSYRRRNPSRNVFILH